jgi:hypothetical protein
MSPRGREICFTQVFTGTPSARTIASSRRRRKKYTNAASAKAASKIAE